jgi:hypothetical protein
VIEGLNHLAFVQRNPIPGRTAETIAPDRIGPFLFLQFMTGSEKARVIGHVEHGRIVNWPRLDHRVGGAIDQHRQPAVDRCRQRCVAPSAKNWRGAGVRIDARKVIRRECETPFRVSKLRYVLKEKGASRWRLDRRRARNEKAQNLNRLSTFGKKGCCSNRVRRFSKSQSAFNRPVVATPLKKGAAVLSDASARRTGRRSLMR